MCLVHLFIQVDDSDDDLRDKRREEQAWTQIFSRLIVQWAQWFSKFSLLDFSLYHICEKMVGLCLLFNLGSFEVFTCLSSW